MPLNKLDTEQLLHWYMLTTSVGVTNEKWNKDKFNKFIINLHQQRPDLKELVDKIFESEDNNERI